MKVIETITTVTETEAFLLESNLIKKFKPKYNIVLKDDKSLPYILITNRKKWPQILKHRGKQKKIVFILDLILQLELLIKQ